MLEMCDGHSHVIPEAASRDSHRATRTSQRPVPRLGPSAK